jgi:DNA polymerase III epsilon subunit-like protein
LNIFSSSVKGCGLLVAHNYSYDYNIMGSELLRNGLENSLKGKDYICTKEASTDFCKLPGPYGYKWPKLEELYVILFSESFNAHNALDDIRATARCFWELFKKKVIKIKGLNNSISLIELEFYSSDLHNKIRDEINQEIINSGLTQIPLHDASYFFTAFNKAIYFDRETLEETLTRLLKNEVHFADGILLDIREDFLSKLGKHIINSFPDHPLLKMKKEYQDKHQILLMNYTVAAVVYEDSEKAANKKIISLLGNYFRLSYSKYLSTLDSDNCLVKLESEYYKRFYSRNNDFNSNLKGFFDDYISMNQGCQDKAAYYKSLVIYLSNWMPDLDNVKMAFESFKAIGQDGALLELHNHNTLPRLNIMLEIVNRLVLVEGLSEKYYSDCMMIEKGILDFKKFLDSQKGGCYIATMAYGDYDHEKVIILRKFRDNILNKYFFGRIFIKVYYRLSPKLVVLLKGNERVNCYIKRILNLFVKILN